MKQTSDPLERLRAANPVPAASVEQTRPDPVLFRAIVTGEVDRRPHRSPRPARRWLRLVVPSLALTGLLGGTVGFALLRDPVPKPQNVGCYETADLQAHTEVVGVGRDGPLAACAELWRRGVLGTGGEVPPLVECVLTTGVVGVFPATSGQDVCATLAPPAPLPTSPTAPPSPPPAVDVTERFRVFREAVLPQFVDGPCLDQRAASDVVRRELDRAGLGDWRITAVGEFTADRPCATLAFRPEIREVALVPSPPRR